MTDVAGSDSSFSGKCYPRYLSVPYLDRLACPLSSSDNCTSCICGRGVEGEDSLVEILVEHPHEGSFEMATSTR